MAVRVGIDRHAREGRRGRGDGRYPGLFPPAGAAPSGVRLRLCVRKLDSRGVVVAARRLMTLGGLVVQRYLWRV